MQRKYWLVTKRISAHTLYFIEEQDKNQKMINNVLAILQCNRFNASLVLMVVFGFSFNFASFWLRFDTITIYTVSFY